MPKQLQYIDSPLTCNLSNLLLQGASFHNYLQESLPDANELCIAPTVTIGFVDKKENTSIYKENEAVSIPVYLTPSREDFLIELPVPINSNNEEGQHKWILAGVALFLTEE